MTIDEAKHIVKTTTSRTLRRDLLKYIKRKERENEPTNAHRLRLLPLPKGQEQTMQTGVSSQAETASEATAEALR